MQFDPNLTNRLDEQQLMIEQIERCRANVVVLAPYLDPREPNDSRKSDSEAFDRWLWEHFELAERAGPYQLLLRRR
jgi:sugar phosphate isomerase/epimerase